MPSLRRIGGMIPVDGLGVNGVPRREPRGIFLYLDTSAILKRHVAEADSDEVIAAVSRADAVVTSLVTRTEMAASITKAVRGGVVDDEGGQLAYSRFLREWPDFWRMPVTDALVARADT